MSQNGTFGDHISHQAASDLYNVEFQVLSSNGPGRETTISLTATTPLCTLILGHFAENHGEHYVCLEDQNYPEEVNNERRQAVSFGDFESNNSQDTFSGPVSGVPPEDETNQSLGRTNKIWRTVITREISGQTRRTVITRVSSGPTRLTNQTLPLYPQGSI